MGADCFAVESSEKDDPGTERTNDHCGATKFESKSVNKERDSNFYIGWALREESTYRSQSVSDVHAASDVAYWLPRLDILGSHQVMIYIMCQLLTYMSTGFKHKVVV
jgi:hypothetical protein